MERADGSRYSARGMGSPRTLGLSLATGLGILACSTPAGSALDAALDAPDGAGVDAHAPDAADAAAADTGEPDAPAGDAGSDALVDDADGDGVGAATETACGTDPDDAASHPDPAVLRGAGTSTDPYRLCFGEHLALFAQLSEVASAHAVVGRDLDLTGIDPRPIGQPSAAVVGVPYAARFDGAHHTLTHYAASQLRGLFHGIAPGGEVVDLHLVDASSGVGAILTASNEGLVRGVTVEGSVTSGAHVSLLVGDNSGIVSDCHGSGAVQGTAHVGGVVGMNQGTVRRCSSTASVTGVNRVGGLVGSQMAGAIEESWASGPVVGTGLNHGGLIGTAFAGSITDSFALGDVDGVQGVGGVVGQSEAPVVVARVYARGHVRGSMSGAVVGIPHATAPAVACYFDVSASSSDASCTGLTTAQIAMQASFVAFDFTTPVWVIDPTIRPSPSLHWE